MEKLKASDWVKVLRKPTKEELSNWNNTWESDMDKSVGKNLQVIRTYSVTGVKLEDGGFGYSYPPCILEKIVDQELLTKLNKSEMSKVGEDPKVEEQTDQVEQDAPQPLTEEAQAPKPFRGAIIKMKNEESEVIQYPYEHFSVAYLNNFLKIEQIGTKVVIRIPYTSIEFIKTIG